MEKICNILKIWNFFTIEACDSSHANVGGGDEHRVCDIIHCQVRNNLDQFSCHLLACYRTHQNNFYIQLERIVTYFRSCG